MKSSLILAEALVPKGSDGAANASPPPAPAWVREQQEGGGGRGKHNNSRGAAAGLRDPRHPLQAGACGRPSVQTPRSWVPKCIFCPKELPQVHPWRCWAGSQRASSPGMDGQTHGQMVFLSAALRQLRRHLRWARLLRELEMGTRAAFVHHCRQPRRPWGAPRAGIPTAML